MPSLTALLRRLLPKRKIYPTRGPDKLFHVINFTISAASEHNGNGEMMIEDSTGENILGKMTVDLHSLEDYMAIYGQASGVPLPGGELSVEEEDDLEQAVIAVGGPGASGAAGTGVEIAAGLASAGGAGGATFV